MSTVNWTNPKVAAIRRNLRQSYEELGFLLDGTLGKLSAEKLYQKPAEKEWTIVENLAHIAEMLPYWAGEVAKLVAQPGQQFGRTMEDQSRLSALREHGHDHLVQIQSVLPGSYTHLDEVLSRLQDSDLALTGHHPRRGEQTLAWLIEEFLTKHLHDHVVQIRECLLAIE